MFLRILPDILRGSTTTICLTILFFVLSQPKYRPRFYFIGTAAVAVVDTLICCIFYITKNYTGVVYYSFGLYLLLVIVGKVFFTDKILQWCFNCVTVLNVYAMVVMLSYYLAYLFPYPVYAMTLIRIFLFFAAIFLFKRYLRPLYLEVSENWGAFLLPTTGILFSYGYMMLSMGDVKASMSGNLVLFCILTAIAVLTYLAIIFSLKSLQQKYTLREENLIRKANEERLTNEICSYERFLSAAKQNRHDLRHHNAILAEYLNNGDVAGAKEYLKLYDNSIFEETLKEYSKNPTANALYRLFDRRCREQKIDFNVQSEADKDLFYFQTDAAILLSNLFENALEACKQCAFPAKHISYSSKADNGSILIEIKNSVGVPLTFVNGLPRSTKEGGGTGLQSVQKIIKKHDGMMFLKQEGDVFFTRIILPSKGQTS